MCIRDSTKVITGKDTRWSYCNIWDAKSINGGTPKYSVSLIIPKADTVTVQRIRAAIEAAYRDGESKLRGNGKTVPPLVAIKNPLRDGDTERPDDPAYANAYFVNANSATAPGVVDAACNPILTRSEVYSGVYGRASISFYAFNSNGNRGIACGLNNLQKICLLYTSIFPCPIESSQIPLETISHVPSSLCKILFAVFHASLPTWPGVPAPHRGPFESCRAPQPFHQFSAARQHFSH